MIRVFNLDGIVVNVDNAEDAQRLIDQEAEEIDSSLFGGHANWACSDNTTKSAGRWRFKPDLDKIKQHEEEAEEIELDMKLTNLVGDSLGDKISKLQSMNPSDGSVAKRYLTKLLSQQSDAEAELTSFI